jgi:hypothetical protein
VAFDQLEDQKRTSVVDHQIEQLDHVGMPELRDCCRFAHQQAVRLAAASLTENRLQCDHAPRRAVQRAIHAADSTGTDQLGGLVHTH